MNFILGTCRRNRQYSYFLFIFTAKRISFCVLRSFSITYSDSKWYLGNWNVDWHRRSDWRLLGHPSQCPCERSATFAIQIGHFEWKARLKVGGYLVKMRTGKNQKGLLLLENVVESRRGPNANRHPSPNNPSLHSLYFCTGYVIFKRMSL